MKQSFCLHWAEERETPWTGLNIQTTTPHTPTFIPLGNLESPFHLICMSSRGRRKPEGPLRKVKLYVFRLYVIVPRNLN